MISHIEKDLALFENWQRWGLPSHLNQDYASMQPCPLPKYPLGDAKQLLRLHPVQMLGTPPDQTKVA
jgi:hypothetical protein